MNLSDYMFPTPPVATHLWTERDWMRWARAAGRRVRRGPAPSAEVFGRFAPFAGEFNGKGEPLYDCAAAFRSPLA